MARAMCCLAGQQNYLLVARQAQVIVKMMCPSSLDLGRNEVVSAHFVTKGDDKEQFALKATSTHQCSIEVNRFHACTSR